jgi:hypothetical protein
MCAHKFKNGQLCPNEPKDGNQYCGRCIGICKAGQVKNTAIEPKKEPKADATARKLLHEIMQQNDVNIEIREWDTNFNPFDALLDIAQEQMQWKDLCLSKFSKLKEDEWRWDGDRAGEQIRSEITLYERAIDRATKTLERIARLGIEDRLMRIAERQAAIVETAIVRTLQDLDLPIELQAKARQKMVMHLRATRV